MSNIDSLNLFTEIGSVNNHLNRNLDRTLGAIHGIGVSDFRVMHQLELAPANVLSRVELAEKVSLTASGITRLLNPMEKIGLIEKLQNERDARVSLVRLTEAGKQRFKQAQESFIAVMDNSLNKLNPSEKNKLIELLGKVS